MPVTLKAPPPVCPPLLRPPPRPHASPSVPLSLPSLPLGGGLTPAAVHIPRGRGLTTRAELAVRGRESCCTRHAAPAPSLPLSLPTPASLR
eukprot:3924391-Pyramimonas_sp.AAC.1